MQSVLGPALQYVFCRLRPFGLPQIGDFPLIEQGAEMPPKVIDRSGPRQQALRHAAIETRIMAGERVRKPRIAAAKLIEENGDEIGLYQMVTSIFAATVSNRP